MANAYLAGRPHRFPVNEIGSEGGKFKFLVDDTGTAGERTAIAETPDAWFAYLARDSAQGLRFHHFPRGEDLRFSWMLNGLSYAVEILMPQGISEFWSPSAETVKEPATPQAPKSWLCFQIEPLLIGFDEPAGRSWIRRAIDTVLGILVLPINLFIVLRTLFDWLRGKRSTAQSTWHWQWNYRRYWRGETPKTAAADLDALTAQLAESLQETLAFSTRHKADYYVKVFSHALALLHGNQEAMGTTLSPPGVLDPTASRLLWACRRGWVFGGMGSWNDLSYHGVNLSGEEEKEYADISGRLFDRIMAGAVGAANASYPPR